MKNILLSLFCLILSTAGVPAASWPHQEVTRTISLSFPVTPSISHGTDQVNYVHQTDSCAFLAQVKDYTAGKVHDSITLASFYDGMVKGILRAAKGTLVRKDSIQISGIKALELEYLKGDENSLPVTVGSRAILLNGEVLIYSFTAPSARYEGMKAIREKFFSAVSFRKDMVLTQYQPRTAADSAAAVAATTAGADSTAHTTTVGTGTEDSRALSAIKVLGLLALIAAVIYFFVRRSRRKQ